MSKKETEEATVSSDYASGITNLRFLAKKHGKSLKQVIFYLKK